MKERDNDEWRQRKKVLKREWLHAGLKTPWGSNEKQPSAAEGAMDAAVPARLESCPPGESSHRP